MIKLTSEEDGKSFLFDKIILIEQCLFFEKAKNLENTTKFVVSDEYILSFSSKCIESFQKYIQLSTLDTSDELRELADYLQCDKLLYDIDCEVQIKPLYDSYKKLIPLIKDNISDPFLKLLMQNERFIENSYNYIKESFSCRFRDFKKFVRKLVSDEVLNYQKQNKEFISDFLLSEFSSFLFDESKLLDDRFDFVLILACDKISGKVDSETAKLKVFNFLSSKQDPLSKGIINLFNPNYKPKILSDEEIREKEELMERVNKLLINIEQRK